jgi:hypothetical protein
MTLEALAEMKTTTCTSCGKAFDEACLESDLPDFDGYCTACADALQGDNLRIAKLTQLLTSWATSQNINPRKLRELLGGAIDTLEFSEPV